MSPLLKSAVGKLSSAIPVLGGGPPRIFRLAHLSDIHVPSPGLSIGEKISLLHPKRLLGALNMYLRRGPNVYSPKILEAALDDMTRQG